ncbi:MAG: hypothetical protein E7492_04155 [Ruminococcaceae bacterium]|nr:hypothetical protein [Oscillospiraceae bacterium]
MILESMSNKRTKFIIIFIISIILNIPINVQAASQGYLRYCTFLNFDFMKTVDSENRHRDYGAVSCIMNGTELMAGWLREEDADIFNAPSDFHNIYAKDYFAPFSTNYSSIDNDDIILKTSAFWNPVKAKVRYVNYFKQPSAKPRQEWIEHFEKALTEEYGHTDSPIIISEAWITWWNGVEYAAVNAANYVNRESLEPSEFYENPQDIPAGENHLMYRVSMVFINGKPIDEYYFGSYAWNIKTQPLSTEMEFFPRSFITPEDETLLYCADYITYQYDKSGNVKKYALYDLCYWIHQEMQYSNTYFFGDVDGDSELEMVVYRRSHNSTIMGGYNVYDLENLSAIPSHSTNDGM